MFRRSCRGREEGAAATEFALIAPLLIMLFFGVVQIGLAIYRTQLVEAAAREAARVASVGAPADDVLLAAINAAPGFDASELTVDTSDLCASQGDDTVVSVSAASDRLNFEIPFVGSYTPTYSASATFRCEAST